MSIFENQGAESSARFAPTGQLNTIQPIIPTFEINSNQAEQFLKILAENEFITFQTLPEQAECCVKGLTRTLHGTLQEHLELLSQLNAKGAGVFYTVNATDLNGRRVENITAIRSVFVDLDGASLEPIYEAPLEPHFIIESSPGRYHAYWIVKGIALAEFSDIQKFLASRFNGDKAVHDLPRLMRLPGFYHLKKSPFKSKIIHQNHAQAYEKKDFLDFFKIEIEKPHLNQPDDIADNQVLNELIRKNLIIRQEKHPERCWTIKCPWQDMHSNQDYGTKYFEPSLDIPTGGFKCFHSHCKTRTIKDLLHHLGLDVVTEPLPLHRPLIKPESFPMEALGNILGEAAKALHRNIQAPDAICAQSVLAAAALACQSLANVTIDGRTSPLSLFLLTVAESGDRKSAVDTVVLEPIYKWQKMLKEVYEHEIIKYRNEYDLWEIKRKEWLKSSMQGDQSTFDEPPPVCPLRFMILIDEPTYEGMVKYLSVGQPSIGLFSDEGGRFFGGHGMNRDNQTNTIGGLSSIWDGKPISRMRSGDGDTVLYGRRLSMHLMIQEIILEDLMNNRMLNNQGFLPRFLISFPPTTAGNRLYVENNVYNEPALLLYKDRINQLLDKKQPTAPPPGVQNELSPRPLNLSVEARKKWISFHNEVDIQLASGKKFEPIKRFASKAAEHVLRIAGVLAMVDDPDVNEIASQYIENGIKLVNYYLTEILRIQGYLAINPETALAQKALEYFWSREQDIIPLADIYQKGPPAIRQAKKAREIMRILQEHGWAEQCPKGIVIEGKKHQEAWKIKPKKN